MTEQSLQLELKHGTTKHQRILERLNARKRFAWRKLRTKHERWRRDEERHRAYVKVSEADALRSADRDDGVPQYTTLEVPYTYGLLMAAHTYFTSVVLGRTPILQYLPNHGAVGGSEQAVEALMDYQTRIGGHLVPHFLWFLDALKYGVGVVGRYWDHERVRVSQIVEVNQTFAGFEIAGKRKKERRTVEVDGYVGNRVYNIRPQDFFWDVRQNLSSFQKGEFAGRYLEISWNDLLIGENDDRYFNLAAVRRMSGPGLMHTTDSERDTGSDQLERADLNDQEVGLGATQIKDEPGNSPAYEIVVNLVPFDWSLGKSRLPEKWVFTVVKESIIVGAQPLGEFSNKYPYEAMEYEIDTHQLYKRSFIEILNPLGDALTWMMNSHFFNVRKALNNMFVYDPMRIEGKDFKDPQAGLGIRLKPAAYGSDINTVIKQFQTQDVTRSHVADMNVLTGLMQRVVGVNDAIMGAMSQGGRRTASENRTSTGFGVNRLKTQVEYMSHMGFGPLANQNLQASQQFYDLERTFRIAGDLLPGGPQDILVTPEEITGLYDFVQVDGTMPVDKFAMATLWQQLMTQMVTIPGLAATYDFASIFAYTAQLAGLKNVQRFKLNWQDPDDLQRMALQQQVVPANEVANGGTGTAGGDGSPDTNPAAADNGRLATVTQLPGVGPTG